MFRPCAYLLLSFGLLGACGGKLTSYVDRDLANRIDTVQDCFPHLYPKVKTLLEVAETWRLRSSSSLPDPEGLTAVEQPDGTVVVSYVASGCTLAMTISFYSPTGVRQDLDLSGATTLADKVRLAATELKMLFGDTDKFMVGAWTLTGPTITGSGALTGIIGGSSGDNELKELRTTVAAPDAPPSGPPANAASSITDGGPPVCALTFDTASLSLDASPAQLHPIGTVSLGLSGPKASVTAVASFDGTVLARLTVTGVPGHFDFDLDTNSLSYVP
ncbi:MAG TPA: hypothetical protein VFZ65_21965 [Planctomycetota bacterium]|nr:hypothetical protein [Planctomycetota bacterium]